VSERFEVDEYLEPAVAGSPDPVTFGLTQAELTAVVELLGAARALVAEVSQEVNRRADKDVRQRRGRTGMKIKIRPMDLVRLRVALLPVINALERLKS